MSVWRDIGDALLRGIGAERRYRLEHPCPTAREFRAREAFWLARGRKVLARAAARRAELWEARCRESGGDC
jgi:hypothetical protein